MDKGNKPFFCVQVRGMMICGYGKGKKKNTGLTVQQRTTCDLLEISH